VALCGSASIVSITFAGDSQGDQVPRYFAFSESTQMIPLSLIVLYHEVHRTQESTARTKQVQDYFHESAAIDLKLHIILVRLGTIIFGGWFQIRHKRYQRLFGVGYT
jgi:hypothetical protein